jgi:hypothetical protein
LSLATFLETLRSPDDFRIERVALVEYFLPLMVKRCSQRPLRKALFEPLAEKNGGI